MTESHDKQVQRRGRPTLARVKIIDATILASARAMFLAEGFDAVAMEQVAAVADISKGTLYNRYPSKEALFKAVIESTIREWSVEASSRDHLLTDDIAARLRHHADTIAQWLFRPEVVTLSRVLRMAQDRFPQLARTMYKAGYLYIVELIARDIEEAASRDSIPARDPSKIARMLVASITGFQAEESMRGDLSIESVSDHAQAMVGILMAARSEW